MRFAIALTTFAALFATTATAQTPAPAAEPACQAVSKAMIAMQDQPGVRQVSTIKGSGGEDRVEAVLLADAMYIHNGERWQRMPLSAVQRKSMAQAALLQMPLSECTTAQSETLNGVAMKVYQYKQPNPMKPDTKTTAKLWVGVSDGLMYRMEADAVTQTVEYGDFKPPM